MKICSKIAARVFPNIFAPPDLKGLPPTWSGILSRMITHRDSRTFDPVYPKFKATNLSTDEIRRVILHNIEEKLKRREREILEDRARPI